MEYDLWQTINALEYVLSDERGKTTRLARTRQKVSRVGVVQTLKDWALSRKRTEGFEMLLERNMPELAGEATILRHPEILILRSRLPPESASSKRKLMWIVSHRDDDRGLLQFNTATLFVAVIAM